MSCGDKHVNATFIISNLFILFERRGKERGDVAKTPTPNPSNLLFDKFLIESLFLVPFVCGLVVRSSDQNFKVPG